MRLDETYLEGTDVLSFLKTYDDYGLEYLTECTYGDLKIAHREEYQLPEFVSGRSLRETIWKKDLSEKERKSYYAVQKHNWQKAKRIPKSVQALDLLRLDTDYWVDLLDVPKEGIPLTHQVLPGLTYMISSLVFGGGMSVMAKLYPNTGHDIMQTKLTHMLNASNSLHQPYTRLLQLAGMKPGGLRSDKTLEELGLGYVERIASNYEAVEERDQAMLILDAFLNGLFDNRGRVESSGRYFAHLPKFKIEETSDRLSVLVGNALDICTDVTYSLCKKKHPVYYQKHLFLFERHWIKPSYNGFSVRKNGFRVVV